MLIRPATPADFARINQIYAQARDFMVRAGNPTQWAGGYPQQAMLDDDVARGNLYVCVSEPADLSLPGAEGAAAPSSPADESAVAPSSPGDEIPAGGRIDAVFYFAVEEDATYARIDDGAWLNDEPYGVVHRIAVAQGTRGLGTHCILWALDRARQLGAGGGLRIDTHAQNAPMHGLLAKLGFTTCGTIYTYDGSPRTAYQHL
ncbi:MAG: GNAT family N-acetyltransferase [Coriobacteriia bacterium]|nr:GNAT family N-acetyltransferase [Coriobacteriia bacterium]